MLNDERDVEELLAAKPVDAGCAAGFEVLHRYVEEALAGGQPARSHPGLAAHLVSCPASRQDYLGLVEAAETFADAQPSARRSHCSVQEVAMWTRIDGTALP